MLSAVDPETGEKATRGELRDQILTQVRGGEREKKMRRKKRERKRDYEKREKRKERKEKKLTFLSFSSLLSKTTTSTSTTSTSQLFAGHETTGTTIARLLRELDSRPELVAKLREEQDGCVADFGDSLSPEAMARMRLADATVSETLRTWPIVNGVFRAALRDLEVKTEAGGRFRVPEG